ncbi:MAG: xanthine dehydrogenase family protein molybdopterin-binding subunit [Alphaproteobacteria bacterium]|nr:xanthine dehydrogenase family protein molybdopterin-binding subunit [Alphaproteobacteria bacterium]
MKFGIGQSVKRTEDIRFVTGQGQYTDDLRFENETFACFHRSPHGHAKILSVDISAAKAAPGVVDVLTYADIKAAGAGPMPLMAAVKSRDGTSTKTSPKQILADGRVTFIGEAIAMVIAETYAQAKDAAELVAVDYEPLDAAGTLETAPSGPTIWESAPGNLSFDWEDGDKAGVDAAFAAAAHVAKLDVVQNRVSAMPMETRNAIGVYDKANDAYTIYVTSQGAGNIRGGLARAILNIPQEKLRVITRDVGGGFGMKGFLYPEQPAVLIAAKKIGRPVRWSAERTESFLADDHGRDMITTGELALDKNGKILALRITGTANMGGYLSVYAPFIPTLAGSRIFGGVYRVPKAYANVKGYFSNSAPVDAYRGAGRPEGAYLMDRLMDAAAAVMGLDRAEIRLRNLPSPEELPMANAWGLKYDSGDYPRLLKQGLMQAGREDFEKRKAESAKRGKLRGFGFGYYVEITGAAGQEPAAIKFTDNGGIELWCGTQSNGQGHETSFAQLVAEKLGVPFESITVKQGDTEWVNGGGTGGSRSLNMSGGALMLTSDEVIKKGKTAAGQVLQAGGKDVGFEVVEGVGKFAVVGGTGQSITVGELAMTLKRDKLPGFENGLDSDAMYQGQASTFPNGCHVCEVEVDPDTGLVEIVSYNCVDDFGRVINPMLVAGQVHGGVVQGLGQALLENVVYEPGTGQLLTASFTDYAMPRASDMPDINFKYEEIVCQTNDLGAKGCGEAGTVGALPAVMSAISDALGVLHIDMPATPERVWRALREKKAAA